MKRSALSGMWAACAATWLVRLAAYQTTKGYLMRNFLAGLIVHILLALPTVADVEFLTLEYSHEAATKNEQINVRGTPPIYEFPSPFEIDSDTISLSNSFHSVRTSDYRSLATVRDVFGSASSSVRTSTTVNGELEVTFENSATGTADYAEALTTSRIWFSNKSWASSVAELIFEITDTPKTVMFSGFLEGTDTNLTKSSTLARLESNTGFTMLSLTGSGQTLLPPPPEDFLSRINRENFEFELVLLPGQYSISSTVQAGAVADELTRGTSRKSLRNFTETAITLTFSNDPMRLKWKSPQSGLLLDMSNWDPQQTPSPQSDILFDVSGQYNVVFEETGQVKFLEVGSGSPIFSLRGQTFTVTEGITQSGGDWSLTYGQMIANGFFVHKTDSILRIQNGATLAIGAGDIKGGGELSDGRILVREGRVFDPSGAVFVGSAGASTNAIFSVAQGGRIELETGSRILSANGNALSSRDGSVYNSGVVQVMPTSAALPLGPSQNFYQARIDGDYVQSAAGRLELSLKASDRETTDTSGPVHLKSNTYQLDITGSAQLAGTLAVDWLDSSAPNAGDRYGLINYASVQGRFSKFEGAAIAGQNDVFFALDYKAGNLDAIVLPTPRRAGPSVGGATPTFATLPRFVSSGDQSGQGLMILAHGTTSGPDGWAVPMAAEILDQPADSAIQNWDVLIVNWSDFDGELPSFFQQAKDTARTGNEIGEGIALWLQDLGLKKYEIVHAVGHSSGAWLADGVIDRLKTQEEFKDTKFVATFFDANNATPDHPDWAAKDLDDRQLGSSADWAEHFVDDRPLPGGIFGIKDTTADNLPNAFNINVTLVDPRRVPDSRGQGSGPVNDLVSVHGWPYLYYIATTNNTVPGDTHDAFGFDTSPYALGKLLEHRSLMAKGRSVILLPDGRMIDGDIIEITQMSINDVIGSDTGTVVFDPATNKLSLETGSPAIATVIVDAEDEFDFLSFDFVYTSNEEFSEGLLSVYIDGVLTGQFDERLYGDLAAGSGLLSLDGTFDPGIHTLTFRLDPFTESTSSIDISNVQLLTGQFVPEPGSLALLGLGAMGLLRRRRANR